MLGPARMCSKKNNYNLFFQKKRFFVNTQCDKFDRGPKCITVYIIHCENLLQIDGSATIEYAKYSLNHTRRNGFAMNI